jgi:hypothetical protein
MHMFELGVSAKLWQCTRQAVWTPYSAFTKDGSTISLVNSRKLWPIKMIKWKQFKCGNRLTTLKVRATLVRSIVTHGYDPVLEGNIRSQTFLAKEHSISWCQP